MTKIAPQDKAQNYQARDIFVREALNLRNIVVKAQEESGLKSILMAGLDEQVGTTSLIVAMALGLCWDRRSRVILLDANFRAPRLHQIFKLENDTGLHKFLQFGEDITQLLQETDIPRLRVIPTAPIIGATPSLNSDYFAQALEQLEQQADIVITDSGALAANPQILFWSTCFDGAVLVAEAMRTRKRQLRETVKDFGRANANLIGVVLNKEKPLGPRFLQLG